MTRLNGLVWLGRLAAGVLGAMVGLLAAAAGRNGEEPEEDRPLTEGSWVMGEYNLRTDRLDAGTDPDGWYEDDLRRGPSAGGRD
jgi:hypothetical protein